jgi:hypothetical protein
MIDTDKYEGVRTPFGIVPTEDILKMLEPIRERDNKIAELDAEVKRLRKQLLRGVEMMNMTPNQTKEARRNRAKRFEREVREMIE